jgi:hypothetical protein
MYGLKQAGLLANQLLQTRLAPLGYYPARHTPGLWLHKTWPISYTLVVDDFTVKYVGKQHAEHLRNALLLTYELTTDWTATVYSGMTLKWDYTHPDATIRYHASDTILHIHSDASYLSVSNARSRLGGLFFLGNKSPEQDTLNRLILNVASVIKNVVASAAESEVGACFHNAQSGAPLRVTLAELEHTQPPTPLRTDNSTAFGILNETIKQKRSNAMDMRYHWLTNRVRQKQFDVYWRPGREHLGDYHTKHHSAQHHKDMRGLILHEATARVC